MGMLSEQDNTFTGHVMTPLCTYFCIDIEANGPVPGLYDMICLAFAP